MNHTGISVTDIIIVILLGIAAGLAVYWRYKSKKQCSHDCTTCQSGCSMKTESGLPAFVEAYRRDHPKTESVSIQQKSEYIRQKTNDTKEMNTSDIRKG